MFLGILNIQGDKQILELGTSFSLHIGKKSSDMNDASIGCKNF